MAATTWDRVELSPIVLVKGTEGVLADRAVGRLTDAARAVDPALEITHLDAKGYGAGRVRAETMLHFLAERNIFVSSGSACGKAKPSHVLSAMQLPKERVETSLRISLSAENTAEEMDAFADALKEGLQTLSHV